jgi:chromosome partitioning protein
MMIVLVANTKGGCGKTTVATHLAAALARQGHRTALADADRQRLSLEWARLRPGTAAPITALDWSKGFTAPPKGLDRVVIDAPAAMKKKDAFELVRMADVIVVPVLPSVFDQGSTTAFLARLNQLKAVRKSHKPVRSAAQPGAHAHTRQRTPRAIPRRDRARGSGRVARSRDLQRRSCRRPVDLRSRGYAPCRAATGLGARARLCRAGQQPPRSLDRTAKLRNAGQGPVADLS